MTREDFNTQIDRLKSTWPNSFQDEKIKIIWNSVSIESGIWFKKIVSDFLANNRQAPLPIEFVEALRIKRKLELLPLGFRDEIHPSKNSVFLKEEISEILNMIRKRLKGEITFDELEQYGQMIQGVIDNDEPPGAA